MNYEEYRNKQVQDAILDSSEGEKAMGKVLDKRIKVAKTKLAGYKALNAGKRIVSNITSARLNNRTVLKGRNKVTVVENEPVVERDKSRFFKTAWEEERKQLFFK